MSEFRSHRQIAPVASFAERRAFPRTTTPWVQAIVRADEVQCVGDVLNMSTGGVLVDCDETIPPGTACRVELSGSDELQVTFTGRVVRVEERGVAIEFAPSVLDDLQSILDAVG